MGSLKKIVFIIPTLNPGGIETYLLRFIKFTNNSFNVTVIVRNKDQGQLYGEYLNTKVDIVFMPLGYLNIKNMVKYYHFFRTIKPNVVCDFNANFAGLSLFIAYLANINSRIAFYRQGKNHYQKSLFKDIYNFISNKLVAIFATQILANSNNALNYFFQNRKLDVRYKVIYNGINKESFTILNNENYIRKSLNIPQNAYLISHSGRLDPAKNHQSILEIAKISCKKNSNVYFVMCGMNTEKLITKITALNLQNNVFVLGYREDVAQILKESDLFIFPSLTEGQPNALIEAMLMNLPILASNIEAIKETVPVSFTSNLLDPKDVIGFVKSIEKAESTANFKNQLKLKEWALENFDDKIRFKEFYNLLIK